MTQTVKRWLKIQSARFDTLSKRERICLFLLPIACFLTVFHVLGLVPAQTSYQAISALLEKQEIELKKARIDMMDISFSENKDSLARVELAALENRIKAARQLIENFSVANTTTPPLAETLTHLLRQQDSLKLLQLRTLAENSQVQQEIVNALPAGVALQGLELTISGAYPELTRYVVTLERELKGIRWGIMNLKSEKIPPELTLQVFLVVVKQ